MMLHGVQNQLRRKDKKWELSQKVEKICGSSKGRKMLFFKKNGLMDKIMNMLDCLWERGPLIRN